MNSTIKTIPNNSKVILNDYLKVYFTFIALVFSVYFLPSIITRGLVVLISFVFLYSKKNYLWLAFFFLVVTRPGNLFASGAYDATFRLPLFTLARGFSFSTDDVFLLCAFGKAIYLKNKYNLLLVKPLSALLLLVVFLLAVSVIFFHAKITTIVDFLRILFFYSLLYSFPRLMVNATNLRKFFFLLFPSIIFIFYTSVYFSRTGSPFIHIFDPNSIQELSLGMGEKVPRLLIIGGGHMLILMCLIFSLVYSLKAKGIQQYYLLAIAFFSYMSIFLTATRVWFVTYNIIIIYYIFKIGGKKYALSYGILIIIMLSIFTMNKNVAFSMDKSWERISSVFTIGQESSMATAAIDHKIDNEFTKLWSGIKESPVIGWGFSEKYRTQGSADIGNWNLIFQVGFFGFILFVYFWFSYLNLIRSTMKAVKVKYFKQEIGIIMFGFISLLVAHFTTHQIFGFNIHIYDHYFLSVYIIATEFLVRETRHNYIQYLNSK